ncbi:MAG: aminotransferase class III-fold pyridoxal phosphate-dependent enzyme, partial [candidate division WOR-3 bacterium]
ACAAAIASIDLFKKEDILKNMQPKITLLKDRLKDIADLPNVGNVRNKGLMAGIELVKDKTTKEPYPWEEKMGWKVAYKAREEGRYEEERRLLYVGITRAKKKLYITTADKRRNYQGNSIFTRNSPFLKEIPDEVFATLYR